MLVPNKGTRMPTSWCEHTKEATGADLSVQMQIIFSASSGGWGSSTWPVSC